MLRKNKWIFFAGAIFVALSAWIDSSHSAMAAEPTKLPGYSAWLPEWRFAQALQEANAHKSGLESIQMFAAYFDRSDKPFLPPRISNWIRDGAKEFVANFSKNPNGSKIPIHLSVVNDIYDPAGSVLKSPELVARLIRNPNARAGHINDLLELLSKGPFDGLEIDYERVRTEDWGVFLEFCAELYTKLNAQGKTMRVVLEPQQRFYTAPLPKGPEYVIMAYNLFGEHSGPGPKANPTLIKNIASYVASMEVKPRLALATGGFVWDRNGSAQSITESEAHLLYQREGVVPKRDNNSGCLVFEFPRNSRNASTVWFADGETLAFLAEAARQNGFSEFALWCFSGNRRLSINQWRSAVTR